MNNQPMIKSMRKKQFHPLMAALLVCAVFGSLFFSKVEMPNNFEIRERKPYSTGIFTPFSQNIYWLAEKTNITSKAKNNPSPAMWNGAPRVLMQVGAQNAAECLTVFSIYIINHFYFSSINNAILLRLRI